MSKKFDEFYTKEIKNFADEAICISKRSDNKEDEIIVSFKRGYEELAKEILKLLNNDEFEKVIPKNDEKKSD